MHSSTERPALQEGQCPECGSADRTVETRLFEVHHSGEVRTISDEQTVCRTCGVVSYVGGQISRHEYAVAAALRDIDGLLSAEELRAIRCKYALRQADLEKMLSTGPKTWTRWERGKVPQSKTADKLIRLLAGDPSLVLRFMQEADVDNPDAFQEVAQAIEDAKKAALHEVREDVLRDRPGQSSDDYLERVFELTFQAAADLRTTGARAA
ncbi:type II TA system antitoxin MqsA family protein [Phenylobacterium sp. VNQ135]|uniref:type II TA system antitoxin MqsA family protein n=1 Tax=Phenylobacterium sp. VNQ135 TaxID=3400922 RepID=UPI003C0CC533